MMRLVISAAITASVTAWLAGSLDRWERVMVSAGTLLVSNMLIRVIQRRLAEK